MFFNWGGKSALSKLNNSNTNEKFKNNLNISINMSEIIQLSKELVRPTDGRTYVANLEEAVRDLSSTPFNNGVQLYHGEDHYASYYDIDYGTNTVRDNSGVPKEKTVWGFDVDIKTLRQLRRHLKKARKTENPDFKIQYKNIEFADAQTSLDQLFGPWTRKKRHGWYERLQRIKLNEDKSSTYVHMKFLDSGLVEVRFEYDPRSYQREIARVNKGVSKLENRGYERQ